MADDYEYQPDTVPEILEQACAAIAKAQGRAK
jgi:hypothetical protein